MRPIDVVAVPPAANINAERLVVDAPPARVIRLENVNAVEVALPGNSYPIVFVNKPVEGLYERPAPADKELELTLFCNVFQSVEVSIPRVVAEADGRLNVIIGPEPVTVKSLPIVEVAKATAPLITCWPVGPTAVIVPTLPPAPTQTPFTAKQPVERLIPFAAVVVAPFKVSIPPSTTLLAK